MRLLLSILVAMLMVQTVSAQALWRNYWTTNRYPQNASSLTNLQATNITGTIPPTAIATNTPTAGQVLTATSAGSAKWSSDIASTGSISSVKWFPTGTKFLFYGDSLTSSGSGWWYHFMTNTSYSGYFYTNTAAGGKTTQQGIDGWATNVAPTIDVNTVLFLWLGQNDYTSVSPAVTCSNLATMWSWAKASNATVVAFTITGSSGNLDTPTQITNLNQINTFIRTNETAWDYLVDVQRRWPNPPLDRIDTVHFTVDAYSHLARIVDHSIKSGRGYHADMPVWIQNENEWHLWDWGNNYSQLKVRTNGVLSANGSLLNAFTVATLPTASGIGHEVWASDVVTSSGTGDLVTYDGTNWRTREKVKATSDFGAFAWNGFESGLNAQNKLTTCFFSTDPISAANMIYGSGGATLKGAVSGTGAQVAWGTFATASGGAVSLVPGTTTTGYASVCGIPTLAIAANSVIASYGYSAVTAACDGTDSYWCVVGLGQTFDQTYPTSGAFFLYDMYTNKLTGALTATSATNHWICVTAKAGAYEYVDSGLTPSTSVYTSDSLGVVYTNGAASFYTNGTLCYVSTSATYRPTVGLFLNKHIIQKTAGTTTRNLTVTAYGGHYRHAARVYP